MSSYNKLAGQPLDISNDWLNSMSHIHPYHQSSPEISFIHILFIYSGRNINSLKHTLIELPKAACERFPLVVFHDGIDIHLMALDFSARDVKLLINPSSPSLFAELLFDVFGVVLRKVAVVVGHHIQVDRPDFVVKFLLILFFKKLYFDDFSSLFIDYSFNLFNTPRPLYLGLFGD
jgi:hypothetical protein